jgi:transcriptional regulator with XRE-family HTH domain
METYITSAARNSFRTKLSDQVRRAVENSHLTQHAVARATGISEPLMSRFLSGKNGLSMAYLDKLADYLQLDICINETSVLRQIPQ